MSRGPGSILISQKLIWDVKIVHKTAKKPPFNKSNVYRLRSLPSFLLHHMGGFALVNTPLPLVDKFLPLVDKFLPLIDKLLPLVDKLLPLVDKLLPLGTSVGHWGMPAETL